MAALTWIRLEFIPRAVEAAFWSGSVFGLILLVKACWGSVATEPVPALQVELQQTPLTCDLAGDVEFELTLELALLADRINETDIEDPALYVLGQEFLALKAMEHHLSEWQDKNDCDIA